MFLKKILAVSIYNWLADRRQNLIVVGPYSCRRSVTSGVPPGSLQRLLLFVMAINYSDLNIERLVNKFAGDTKIAGVANVRKAVKVYSGISINCINGHGNTRWSLI